ncbi:putative ribonuclease H-like domain-containing protein [Tanacetum coccineum]
MSQTRADYGSGVARPKIKEKDSFELKGQFLKELRDNTFSGSDHEDANENIKKVLKIVDLFHILNITIDQVILRAFLMSLTGAASRWLRNKPSGSITTWEDLKSKFLSKYCPHARTAKKIEEINNFQQEPDENLYQAWERFKELLMKCPQHYLTEMQEVVLFYNGLDVSTRQILDSKGVIPSKTAADAKVAIQEMAEYSQKWHNGTSRARSTKTSNGLAAIHAQLNNLGRVTKKVNEKAYAAQVGCEQCKGPHYTKDFLLKEEGKTLEEAYYTQFGAPFQGGGYRAKTQGASISVMPLSTYLNLGLGELAHTKLIVELAYRTVKYPKGVVENILVGIGKFTFPVELIILDMPEDIKVPLILGRPFLSTAHAKINVYKRKITLRVGEESIIFKSVKPASSLIKRVYMLSLRERMKLDLEARLMGETLVLNRSLDLLNGDYIELNDLNVPIELRRDQVDDLMPTIEEGEVIKEFRARNDTMISGYPSNFDHDKKILLENMDGYRDEEMGDVIFGEPFLREVKIKATRFDGMITIYNGEDEVTYQMVRSHPRFKHRTDEQCNKIPPLPKDLAKRKLMDVGGEFTKSGDPEVLES